MATISQWVPRPRSPLRRGQELGLWELGLHLRSHTYQPWVLGLATQFLMCPMQQQYLLLKVTVEDLTSPELTYMKMLREQMVLGA